MGPAIRNPLTQMLGFDEGEVNEPCHTTTCVIVDKSASRTLRLRLPRN
jgi:hypothetical protein